MDPAAPRSGRVEVKLRDGRTVSHFTRHAPGHEGKSPGYGERERKGAAVDGTGAGRRADRGSHPAGERPGSAGRCARATAIPGAREPLGRSHEDDEPVAGALPRRGRLPRLGTARRIPEQADPAGDRFRARRRGRLRGAGDERRVREGARPAGGGGKQAGRRLEHRRGASGQGPARRLHAADREPQQHFGQSRR